METDLVLHTYILDGWPGPCVVIYAWAQFLDWFPCLTIERAERLASNIRAA